MVETDNNTKIQWVSQWYSKRRCKAPSFAVMPPFCYYHLELLQRGAAPWMVQWVLPPMLTTPLRQVMGAMWQHRKGPNLIWRCWREFILAQHLVLIFWVLYMFYKPYCSKQKLDVHILSCFQKSCFPYVASCPKNNLSIQLLLQANSKAVLMLLTANCCLTILTFFHGVLFTINSLIQYMLVFHITSSQKVWSACLIT